MDIRSLAGRNICILGFGREGQAMVAALEKYASGCEITIADANPTIEIQNPNYWKQIGTGWLENLNKFDVIIKSPGIPPNPQLKTLNSKLTTSTQIFFNSIAGSGATIIGITGSKGKSTTASLIHTILQTQHSKLKTQNFLVGNIGNPAIAHIGDAKSNTIFGECSRTIFVHELSSYQLMDLTLSPQIAVITAFFPEHLDYHSTRCGSLMASHAHSTRCGSLMASHTTRSTPLENYLEAKKHITRFQTPDDLVFFNAESEGAMEIAREGKGKKIPVRIADAPLTLKQTRLQGQHNLMNIALAWKVAEHLGVPKEAAIAAIASFTPLPHRLESIGIHDGIEWVNDSISTTPQSTIAALDALGDRVKTVILGGQDRGYDFTSLAKRLKKSNVQTVILMPDSGRTILRALQRAKVPARCIEAKNMGEAIQFSKRCTQSSKLKAQSLPIVLLSPASPSYGHFKNFEDRGEQFKKSIE